MGLIFILHSDVTKLWSLYWSAYDCHGMSIYDNYDNSGKRVDKEDGGGSHFSYQYTSYDMDVLIIRQPNWKKLTKCLTAKSQLRCGCGAKLGLCQITIYSKFFIAHQIFHWRPLWSPNYDLSTSHGGPGKGLPSQLVGGVAGVDLVLPFQHLGHYPHLLVRAAPYLQSFSEQNSKVHHL